MAITDLRSTLSEGPPFPKPQVRPIKKNRLSNFLSSLLSKLGKKGVYHIWRPES